MAQIVVEEVRHKQIGRMNRIIRAITKEAASPYRAGFERGFFESYRQYSGRRW